MTKDFFSSSDRDLYALRDDDLKHKLAYAWTLPANARFIGRMKSVQDGVNELLPTTELLKSRINHFIRQIRNIVIERIELHRVRLKGPNFKDMLESPGHVDVCDNVELDLPALID
ncbi:hypothetical protein M413DRAFT_32762 [Hebeloma cylindrosporum]|uniref:Uncharacterized protein n=1 Tax=Hebeloma cylindrosporum TaxID=76867 RepID=A0A0C3BE90_HEBCY|nr:hypothetical protein M413DRAFT_32762 [Hebeloma cylindrosporum h7]